MHTASHEVELKEKGYTKVNQYFSHYDLQEINKTVKNSFEKYITQLHKHGTREEDVGVDYILDNDQYLLDRMQYFIPLDHPLWQRAKYIFENILNDTFFHFKDRVIYGHPGREGSGIHQDNFSFIHAKITKEVYTVYVALTNTTEQTGALFVEDSPVKTTEKIGFCDTGCSVGNPCICAEAMIKPEALHSISTSTRNLTLKPVPLKKGDCLVFDGYLPHAVGINLGNRIRKVMTFTFAKLDEDVDLLELSKKYRAAGAILNSINDKKRI